MAFNNNFEMPTEQPAAGRQPSQQGSSRSANRRKPVARGKFGVALILILTAAGIWIAASLLGFPWVGSSWAAAGDSLLSFWGGALIIPILFWLYLCAAWLMRLRPPRIRRQLTGTVLLYISMAFMLGLARSTGWNPFMRLFEPGRFGSGMAGFFILNLGVPGAVLSAVILLLLSAVTFGSRVTRAAARLISSDADAAADDAAAPEEPSASAADIPLARRRRSMPHGRLVVPPDFDDYSIDNAASYAVPSFDAAAESNAPEPDYAEEQTPFSYGEPAAGQIQTDVYEPQPPHEPEEAESDKYADDYEDNLRDLHANDYYVAIPGVNVRISTKKQPNASSAEETKENAKEEPAEKAEVTQDEAPAVNFRIDRFAGGSGHTHFYVHNAPDESANPMPNDTEDPADEKHEAAESAQLLRADIPGIRDADRTEAEAHRTSEIREPADESSAGRSTIEILDGLLASLESMTPPHASERADDDEVRHVRRAPRRPAVSDTDILLGDVTAEKYRPQTERIIGDAPVAVPERRNDSAGSNPLLIEYENGGVWTDIRESTSYVSDNASDAAQSVKDGDSHAPEISESGSNIRVSNDTRRSDDADMSGVSVGTGGETAFAHMSVPAEDAADLSAGAVRSPSDSPLSSTFVSSSAAAEPPSAAAMPFSGGGMSDLQSLTETLRRVSEDISSGIMSASDDALDTLTAEKNVMTAGNAGDIETAEAVENTLDSEGDDPALRIRKGAFPPPLDIFGPLSEAEDDSETRIIAEEQAATIVSTLKDFAVNASVANIVIGPSVIQFQLELAPGTRVNKVSQLANDLMMALAVVSVRIEAPILGQRYVGVEIPNVKRRGIPLRDAMEAPEFADSECSMPLPMGMKVDSSYLVCGLEEMPHLLVAGTTGSGKSVFVNACILGMCSRRTPDELKLILVDPKRVEFAVYDGLPHLLAKPISDSRKAIDALTWAVQEMERRGETFERAKVRNLASYNQKVLPKDRYPNIVVVVDELADLMYTAGKEVESLIARLAQKARAAGIHLILATQRPSVDVVTGLIKANVPARVAFAVPSLVDSRTIIDTGGADALLGRGDMLFLSTRYPRPLRLQAPFISEERTLDFVEYMRDAFGEPEYVEFEDSSGGSGSSDSGGSGGGGAVFDDPKMEEAIRLIMDSGITSASGLQRYLSIGYPKAGRIIAALEQLGILGPQTPNSTKPRDILMDDISAMDALERARNGGAFDD